MDLPAGPATELAVHWLPERPCLDTDGTQLIPVLPDDPAGLLRCARDRHGELLTAGKKSDANSSSEGHGRLGHVVAGDRLRTDLSTSDPGHDTPAIPVDP